MVDVSNLDRKIKRLGGMEARYRAAIKEAQRDARRDPDRRKVYERTIERYERKIAKVLPKIRRLREIRAHRLGRG